MKKLLLQEFPGLPPTVNQMYRSSFRTHRYKQPAVAAWQDDIATQMAMEWNKTIDTISLLAGVTKTPYTGRAAVKIKFTVNTSLRWDIDNRIKVLLDCFKFAGVLQDDSQIDHLSVTRTKGQKLQTRIILLEFERGNEDEKT